MAAVLVCESRSRRAVVDERSGFLVAAVVLVLVAVLLLAVPTTVSAAGPFVDRITPDQATPGSVVTVMGSGFGAGARRDTVDFPRSNGQTVAGTVVSWSATSIRVEVPRQAVAGFVVVSVGGVSSNGVFFNPGDPTVVAPCTIDSLSTYYGAPGTQVVISGSGFGDTQRNSYVTFGGTRQNVAISWTDTQIVVTVPVKAMTGYVGVVMESANSNGLYFIPFDPPNVTSMSPATAPPGTAVTFTGTGFGTDQGGGFPVFSGVPGQVVSWSDTQVVAIVPPTATTGYAGVVQNSLTSNGKFFVPFGLPAISSTSIEYALVEDVVTVRGTDFRDTRGMLTVGGTPVDTVLSWSDTEIVFEVPPQVTSGYVGVLQDGFCSNGVWLTVAPRIQGASTWWVEPGDVLTLTGVGFGATQGDGWACLDGRPVPVVSWSQNAVTVRVPADATSGLFGVVRASWATSNGWQVTVTEQAQIAAVDASYVLPGQQIAIDGSGFGGEVEPRVLIAGVHECTVLSWTDTRIVARVPDGVLEGYLGVYKEGVPSNGVWLRVGVPVPHVDAISSWWGLPGDTVTITGWGFGPEQGSGYPVFAGVPAAVVSWSDRSVTAIVPSGATSGYAGIFQSGMTSNGVFFMPCVPPTISSLSTTVAAAGDAVTVSGEGFRASPGLLTVGGIEVAALSWSDNQVVFEVPVGLQSGYVGVTHDGKQSNGLWLDVVE